MEKIQSTLKSKGYGNLSMGVAAALMLLVVCPMSVVTVAAPYWTSSNEIRSSQASLWKYSVSIENEGVSADQDVDMCGDDMNDFKECGKIHAVRLLRITALLLCFVSGMILSLSGMILALSFSNASRTLSIIGVSLSAAVMLCDFLSICIAARVHVGIQSKLNGVGFVFLILEFLLVSGATALVEYVLTKCSTKMRDAAAVVNYEDRLARADDLERQIEVTKELELIAGEALIEARGKKERLELRGRDTTEANAEITEAKLAQAEQTPVAKGRKSDFEVTKSPSLMSSALAAAAETVDAAAAETPVAKGGKSDFEANKSPSLTSSAQNEAQKSAVYIEI